jgi:Acyl-CoA dehydrogenase, C-terminal domain
MMQGSDLEIFERSLRQATSRHSGETLDSALFDLGWLDALESDSCAAISMLFPLQGAANATSFALDQVVIAGLATGPALGKAAVLPSLGQWSAPGELSGGVLSVRGLGGSALRHCDSVTVVARTDDPAVTTVLEVDAAALTRREVDGLDPAFGLVEVSGVSVPYHQVAGSQGPADRWTVSVAMAQLATGYELVGAARAMLELARQHALDRVQFGQPISRFQAIRHRLAETLVAIEAADAVLAAAAQDLTPQLSAAAKALAGRGARTAGRHCQQVLAGIGFTAEHPFHRYLKRVLLLDQLFGTSRSLTEQLGQELLASRRLPALLPL